MSHYINVLRRLERDRRMPEAVPSPLSVTVPVAAPVAIPVSTRADAPVSEPIVPIAPIAPPVEPLPIPTPRSETTVPVATPSPTPRTVVPLPTSAHAPAPVAAPAPVTPAAATPAAETRGPDTRRSRAFATEAHPGIATLLDNIRLISNGRESRTVVFCGASKAEAVEQLANSLTIHAERSGMRTILAKLHRSVAGATVVPATGSANDVLAVDLDAGTSPDTLIGWSQRIAPASDLIVITGPPLASSIDAALLACASDGLVIVAESEVTERAALQVAAERARIAGCKTLGVVMHGTKNRVPSWLRRLVGDRSETHAPRED